jgi:hypothetical protein
LQKIEFEEEFFYVIFFLFTLYCCLSFLDGNKRNVAQQSLHLTSNDPQIEYIAEKIQNSKNKNNKTKCEGLINKSIKIPKYFLKNFILKRAYLLC